jgi:hypothetical protein
MKKILLSYLLILLAQVQIYAGDIKGGKISYTCLGSNKYKITATVGRECFGYGIDNYDIYVYNGLGKMSLNAKRVFIKNLEPLCPGDTPVCIPNKLSSGFGTEEHVFEATVDFNSGALKTYIQNKSTNCEVYFSFEAYRRDQNITTVSAGNFFISAMLNLCVVGGGCNSTPVSAGSSTRKICIFNPYYYTADLKPDMDKDSIAFDTIAPKTGATTYETYMAGYSKKYPLTPYCTGFGKKDCKALPESSPPRGLYFDHATGDFLYTPVSINEVAPVVFRINEYRIIARKPVLVGYSENEVVFYIYNCAQNKQPYITGSTKQSVCAGEKICIKISGMDDPFLPQQTVLDTVELSAERLMDGATFSIVDSAAREKEADFCWQTTTGDVSTLPYTFFVRAIDKRCSQQMFALKKFSITVKPVATDARKYTQSVKEGKLVFEAIVTSDTLTLQDSSYRFKFTIRDSSDSDTFLYRSNVRKDSFNFSKPGKYIIEHEINNVPFNCPTVYIDTIRIEAYQPTELAALLSLSLYIIPNPAQHSLFVGSTDSDLSGVIIRIYSTDGKTVYEGIPDNGRIDVSALARGMYILGVSRDSLNIHQRIVLE